MSHSTTVVGLDVHKESIIAAVLEPEARRFALTTKIANEPAEVRKFVDRLRSRHRLSKFLLRQGLIWLETTAWGVKHRAWVRTLRFDFPALQNTFESYLRAVEDAEARLGDLDRQVLELSEQPVWKDLVSRLRSLKGIDTLSALTIAVEVQDFKRFSGARQFMGYTGLVSREYSSGQSVHRGRITKVGNVHVRRVLVEAAWSYSRGTATGPVLAKRRESCPPEVMAIARRAQERLSRKFRKLTGRGKARQNAIVSVVRELAGFVWAIGRTVPQEA